jgi:hypothetical protein
MIRATREERRKSMAESGGVRVTHEEVEAFVGKLKDFHGSLDDSEQAMLGTILESAQGGETGGYRVRRSEDPSEESSESSSGWNDLIGWIEEQGDEDTQGFRAR